MRKRVDLKSPVREYRPPGSVRGAPGNRRPYLDNDESSRSTRATLGLPRSYPTALEAAADVNRRILRRRRALAHRKRIASKFLCESGRRDFLATGGFWPSDGVEVGHEVGREAVEIAPDRFVQVLGLDAIERG